MLSKQHIQEIADHFKTHAEYTFKNKALLIQALTRKSAKGIYVAKNAPDFERLEFIGDSILRMAIVVHLADLHPTATEGDLHKYAVQFIRNTNDTDNGGPLYRVAKQIQIERFILKSDTDDLMRHGKRGKRSGHKKSKEGHLSDHIEALIGAMFYDCNRDMSVICAWIKLFWQCLGLNEDAASESSFGASTISDTALTSQDSIIEDDPDFELLDAAFDGDFHIFNEAIRKGASIFKKDAMGRNALHFCALNGHRLLVEYILDSFPQLDVDKRDDQNNTALYYAAKRGKVSIVEQLLEHNASIHIKLDEKSPARKSIYWQSTLWQHVPVMNLILKYQWYAISVSEIEQCMQWAKEDDLPAMEPHLKKALVLIKQNARMFSAANNIIHKQSYQEDIEVVKNAIKLGANVYARNNERKTMSALLKEMPIDARFDIFLCLLTKKIKFDEIKFVDLCHDLTKAHQKIISPVHDRILLLRKDNEDVDEIVEILDDWLQELANAMKPPAKISNAPVKNIPVSKSASVHFTGQGNSAASSSSASSRPSGKVR